MPPLRAAETLPIDAELPRLREALADQGAAVVVAAPGAGKTTRIPLDLLDAPWRTAGRILVLEPRRIAARAAAQQMARLLGESVGETVGYRVRHESRVGPRTRVEVVTEGILTRMVQDDAALDGVAAVLFDEYHERHLTADLGLALVLESKAVLRPELRIVVMSATLEAAPVAQLLGDAPVIASEGRQHPVETRWRPVRDGVPLAMAVAGAVRDALRTAEGDVLVFLPGIAEIQRVRTMLAGDDALGAELAEVQLLHGGLTLAEQDLVLRSRGGRRRVILSTSIAESSVTLDGVRTVVDAGLARVPRFDARSGMTRLETVRVSRASADQRRGRAGRTAPGTCIRLWDEGAHASLPARTTPEILEADLAPLALELACAGVADPASLRWLDAPPAGALAQGRALLSDLGALDGAGRVTPHGRAMAALGITPRLAHLVLEGTTRGADALACDLAALIAERDILRREAAGHDADVRTRVEALRTRGAGADVDRGRLERVREEARALRRMVGARDDANDIARTGELLALAFPDRLAMRRPGEAPRYLLRNGRGARLAIAGPLGRERFLAIADLDGAAPESRIWLAAPLDEAGVRAAAGAAITNEREVVFDATDGVARGIVREQLGAIVLGERIVRDVPAEQLADAIVSAVRASGLGAVTWTDGARELRARLAFAHAHFPAEFPAMDDASLLARLDEWLRPALGEPPRLSRVEGGGALLDALPWALRGRLDRVAPTHLEVPSGSRIPIDYSDPAAPVMAVRLQEVFGLVETPHVAEGRVPLTMHLLSPAHRPVQVTRDLASFWRSGYFEVRRDLKGRYPRHHWPDDPLTAPATRRAKPRGT